LPFSQRQKEELLQLKGVGPTVLQRLEQIGITTIELLAESTVEEITENVAEILQTTCWKNSPQAKSAIQNAIEYAKKYMQNA